MSSTQNLWVGGSVDAAKPLLLQARGIRRVLNLAGAEAVGDAIPGVEMMVRNTTRVEE
jgi:hypothetical protein